MNIHKEHRAPWECVYAKEDKSNCRPGKKPKSDQEYFEILCLCILQAGFSWGVIRKHWQKYREGLFGFNIYQLSNTTLTELLKSSKVIKNTKKLEAIIYNAREFQKIGREYESFRYFLKSFGEPREKELSKSFAKSFKHIGIYTAEYYLHSVGHWK